VSTRRRTGGESARSTGARESLPSRRAALARLGSIALVLGAPEIVWGAAIVAVRVWPAVAGPKELCDKLTANMSHKQWNEWVSPDIDYIKVCPDLPMSPD